MQYIEYIQTDGYCWFDTGIIPSIDTKVEIVNLWPGVKAGDWPVYFGKSDTDWTDCTYTFKSNNAGTDFDSKFGNQEQTSYCPFTVDSNYNVVFDKNGITINNTLYAWASTPVLDSDSHTLWIAAENNDSTGGDWDRHRASIAKFGEIKVWENNVLIGDFKPVINDNQNIGFYDEVSQSFKANLGTGTPVAGPSLSSISVSASKNVLAASGETINIDVDCENAWTVSGNTWLTLSSTGDTSGTTITATAPDYSGSTNRTDTLVFTDTDTGDEVSLTIRQKKLSNGQPFYLGTDEITEMFLGLDGILEAYLGDVLVFSSGPFEGLKITPKTVQFFSTSLTTSIKVKASEQWSLTTPAWVSASVSTGDTGETIVTLTATTQTATTTDTITVTSANYNASATAAYYVVEELAYIQNGTASTRNTNYLIDTNYVPTLNTTVEISLSVEDWDGNSIFSTDKIEGGWWRFFTFQNGNYFMDCPRDSNARVSVGATLTAQNTIKMWLADGKAYIQNGEGTPNSGNMPQTPVFTTSLKLWGGTWQIAERTKIYFIKLYESGVLTMNLIPAKLGNDVGLFDTIGGVLYTNLRSGVLTYGELSQ